MMSSVRIGTKIEITPEMIEAARYAGCDNNNDYGMSDADIAAIYRAMRALEEGRSDPGVLQAPGVSPYARTK